MRASRSTGVSLRAYEAEVRFYRDVAGTVGIRTPRCHFAAIDVSTGWFTLVLDFLDSRTGRTLAETLAASGVSAACEATA